MKVEAKAWSKWHSVWKSMW